MTNQPDQPESGSEKKTDKDIESPSPIRIRTDSSSGEEDTSRADDGPSKDEAQRTGEESASPVIGSAAETSDKPEHGNESESGEPGDPGLKHEPSPQSDEPQEEEPEAGAVEKLTTAENPAVTPGLAGAPEGVEAIEAPEDAPESDTDNAGADENAATESGSPAEADSPVEASPVESFEPETAAYASTAAAAGLAGGAIASASTAESTTGDGASITAPSSESGGKETATEPQAASPVKAAYSGGRLLSLDALRGFDMFWIVGAHGLFLALTGILKGMEEGSMPAWLTPWLTLITTQLEHVSWEGFHFYDLIFPMFVFITGASTVFSVTKRLQTDSKTKILGKIIWRTVFLYALGLFYYAGMDPIQEFGDLRYMGVLQRIAIAYGIGATLFLYLPVRHLIVSFAVILIGYYLALAFIPFEGYSGTKLSDRFEEGSDMNLVNNFDKNFLKGYKWDGDHDPEGVLSNIPAVGSGLLGIFAGLLLINPDRKKLWKFGVLVGLGVVCLALGYGWGFFFPVIKKLWTSSFVLMAGGWSFLLLAFFFLVIDMWGLKFWAWPFIWIGSNAITIYMMWQIVDFHGLAGRIVQFAIAEKLGIYAPMAQYLLALLFAIGILRFLYVRKVHIRI